ncbi:MAG: glucose-6-phosphate isomerase [Alphaproteobacteria bacterium]|nr:glucose-6-phosphate isomerase [Alphaproteobacteria bacterium]
MSNNALTKRPEWLALENHFKEMEDVPLRALFADDPSRFDHFHLRLDGLLFDYSKHKINARTKALLCALARACDVEGWRARMLSGAAINTTENRAVLHMALRGSTPEGLEVDGENVTDFVQDTLALIKTTSERVRADKSITDVVNIGIGGSDLGPRMMCRALIASADGPNIHFISNIDGDALSLLLGKLNPHSTVFLIASKTFNTLETLTNTAAARDWLLAALGPDKVYDHFLTMTANPEAALKFGIAPANILLLRNWIGGRYSLWGATGLALAIACGFEVFNDMLKGAAVADRHFIQSPLEENIPVLMALIGIWYRNFWKYDALAILPYAQSLEILPSYIQQLDMESNGKGAGKNGETLDYQTGPVVFGETGSNAQHAFMQLLHQSRQVIPAEFIAIAGAHHGMKAHHMALFGNALAQSKALMDGLENTSEPCKNFPGNRPSSTLILDQLDAYHLGMLLALYEHKIAVQGAIWNINSFDQWGVELGKSIADALIKDFDNDTRNTCTDSSTAGLAQYFREKFIKS